jgi:hypothetical protein
VAVTNSINNIDTSLIPFSRRYTRLMMLSGPDKNAAPDGIPDDWKEFTGGSSNLHLWISYTGASDRYDLIKVMPTRGGAAVEYTQTTTPGKLTLTDASGGILEFVYGNGETLLIRGKGGLGLRLGIRFKMHEQFMDRLDGTVYTAFEQIGEFLFESVDGTMAHNYKWIAPMMKPADAEIAFTPDSGGNLFAYVHYSESSVNRPELPLGDFDAHAAANYSDFKHWAEKYPKAPAKYADMRLLSAYIIWVCCAFPKGELTTDFVLMMRNGMLMRAMGWHQAYHAMSLYSDIDAAVTLLESMFTLQDEYGQLPDGATHDWVNMLAPKPPFQGFALAYILDKAGIDALTEEHCRRLYYPMTKWVSWWTEFRTFNGLLSYTHGDESGWDDASIFVKGMPVASPDLYAFLIFVTECQAKLAVKLGKPEEASGWLKLSQELLDTILTKFWNGEKFIAIKSDSGEVIDSRSIALYQPIILGKRLPQEVIDKIAGAVEREFISGVGITSESMLSPYYDVSSGAFMLGLLLAPVQYMMTLGLYLAGKTELAKRNAKDWCDSMLSLGGPETVSLQAPKGAKPKPYNAVNPVFPFSALDVVCHLSSWGAVTFIMLASLLEDE